MEERIWWKEAVVYQIYPKSFCDSNGDGIGDLGGILSKLDYLKFLGVDILWLSPVYKSPNCDNGYDISDYQDIMDEFGTMEEFDHLLEETHRRGMRLIMDLVVNHTSDEHPWFIESRKGADNPYGDYYIWKEPRDGKEPNNWGGFFGGSVWEFDEGRKQYYLHLFSKKQPDLNWKNPRVREDVFQMMRWWLDKGIDGFRMDTISLLSKEDDYRDGELKGLYGDITAGCVHGPHIHEYLREMNEKVLRHYDILSVGEATGVTLEDAKKYAGYDRRELDMVFQFEHVEMGSGEYGKWNNEPLDLIELKKIIKKWQDGLEGVGWNSLFWSNHDQPRAVSRFGNDKEYWRESAKMLATCLHLMKGTPFIYQGEEIGMTNAYFENLDDYRDIESINAYDELVYKRGVSSEEAKSYLMNISRDNARTPMQWTGGEEAGFTDGEPWIPVNRNHDAINVESQRQEEDSILNYYRRIIALRHELPVIVYGDFKMLKEEDCSVFAYERRLGQKKLTVICNFSGEAVSCDLLSNTADILISNYKDREQEKLRPYEAVVYKES